MADSNSIQQALEQVAGPQKVSQVVAGHPVDGRLPTAVVRPDSVAELGRVMAAASDGSMAVAPRGGGTRTELGNIATRLDVVVDMTGVNRIVEHNPADLTATVEAGITVASLRETLANQGQFLAMDPPVPDKATVGGTLATGNSGPLKWQFGSPRDVVIGMKVVQADGKITSSGGRVVKNVSGYDMTRLHIGGLGTLGIIAEVSFKLTPLPSIEMTVVAAFDSADQAQLAGLAIFHSNVVPLALTAFDAQTNERAAIMSLDAKHFLAVKVGGRSRTVQRQLTECRRAFFDHDATSVEAMDDAGAVAVWRALSDFGWDDETKPMMSARASCLPNELPKLIPQFAGLGVGDGHSPAIVSQPGYGVASISWFPAGADFQCDEAGNVLAEAREATHSAGGHMIIERCPSELKSRYDVWDSAGEVLDIMRAMREQYDPKRIINPGRFMGGI